MEADKIKTIKKHPFIYVTKNQEIQGPYTPAEIRTRMLSSQYANQDMAWYEGRPDWIQLSELLNSLPGTNDQKILVRKKSSGYARSSLYIGLLGLAIWFMVFLPTISAHHSEDEPSTLMLIMGVFMYGAMGASALGIVFSVLAFINRYSNNSIAIYGLLCNSVVLIMLFFTVR